ncbi:DUF7373 family lipoprotein [Nocardia neocaledoniensis]|uniref:DUF7373 family lipoprotein n=1 Tax=Nocardia neocaledoniensis TaxID=236511 RepID=UPI0024567F29|nr:hypothetical protein [Nocardia neocaledoniensis]
MKNSLRVAGLLAALAVVTGCAAPISGQARPAATPVDLAALKTGAQVTEPTEFVERFPSATSERIRLIEGRRLLNILVHPIDYFPSLTELGYTRIFANADAMSKTGGIPAQYNDAVFSNKLVVGVSAVRTNGSVRNTEQMLVGILQFASEQDAKNAAAAMFQVTTSGERPRQPVAVPGYPEANASSLDDTGVNSFQQHGPFVIVNSATQSTPDVPGLAARIKKSMDAQIPALDKFQVIAPDDLMDLPRDREGIVRRTMDKSAGGGDPFGISFYNEDFGVFEASGILHYERNTLETRKAFEEAGVDLVGRRYSTVYRARDVEAAFKLQTVLAKRAKNDTVLAPPPGIADAQCVRLAEEDKNREYNGFCVLVYDRYVAVVMSLASVSKAALEVDPVLQERTAAQYAILKKSE